jgi:pyrimidine dimer DNA glycosylase
MRLWSLHPSLLDRIGLVALWREALLAQKVLLGATKGYRHHPQLERFRQSRNPVRTIANYLWSVADEAKERGYDFDVSKITMKRGKITLLVTTGQLAYELMHLRQKLHRRDPKQLQLVDKRKAVKANPIFRAVQGPIASWERTSGTMRAKRTSAFSMLRQVPALNVSEPSSPDRTTAPNRFRHFLSRGNHKVRRA